MANGDRGSLSGLTPEEAQEFHGVFMSSFIGWIVICFIAHVLVWFWRPWFPGAENYKASMLDGTRDVLQQLLPYVA